MKFCIVIPTYNSVRTLPAAVESALAQAHGDFAVLVSDNASTDGSTDYLRGLGHPRLRVVCNGERLGKTDNWNRAFGQAPECDYLVMLHSDDVLHPGALAALAAGARRFPDAAMLFGSHDRLTVDGGQVIARKIWPWFFRARATGFERMQSLSNNVSVVGVAFRRQAFLAAGGFPREYQFVQDVLLYSRLAERGTVVYCPAKLGLYRDTPVRPANALDWSVEQVKWMEEACAKAWPAWLGRRLLALHALGEIHRIRRENAQLEPVLADYLQSRHIVPGRMAASAHHIRMLAARGWKLVYSLRLGLLS